jgi:hypothetical protein
MRSLLVLFLLVTTLSFADLSPSARRDAALKAIDACTKRNDVASRECRKLNANVETLIGVYKQGDKTVLPTLFRFTYLTDFYGEALLSDPRTFLTAMSQLQDENQKAVAVGIAGGMFGLRSKQRFEMVRSALNEIPDSAQIKGTAEVCLRALERINASFFQSYFPPKTFTSRAADFKVHWFSSEMYALGEKPLWPPVSSEEIYRLTYLPAFSGPAVLTLIAKPDREGQITIKELGIDRNVTTLDETLDVSPKRITQFIDLLDQAHFWTIPTESEQLGTDGAEWIVEGVQNGRYRTVVRFCPKFTSNSVEQKAFAQAGILLFEMSGHRYTGGC